MSGWLAALTLIPLAAFADRNIAVVSSADPEYTRARFQDGKVRRETYVFMEGKFFEGITRDPWIEKMPFRKIAESLAAPLATQELWPAKSAQEADLVIVVHWGTTRPHATTQELTGRTSSVRDLSNDTTELNRAVLMENAGAGDFVTASLAALGEGASLHFDELEQLTEQLSADLSGASNALLLGYSRRLRQLSKDPWSTEEERTLRYDLAMERYFIILKAYDLKYKNRFGAYKPVWTLHMNVRSPGTAFRSAVAMMGAAGALHIGRTNDAVLTVRPKLKEGTVEIGAPVILEMDK